MAAPTPKIPDHDLLSRIGQGSYGDVWLARNALGAYRAVKIVYRNRFQDRAPFDREFAGIRRFEPISRSHESLVDVLHVGDARTEGYFYYVMELADDVRVGQAITPDDYVPNTLTQQLHARRRLPQQECVELGLALSSGLAHLHESGLVHRDVKPSNVVFINGKAKIVDIGLVTAIADAASWVGTQGFIPPEGPGTPQADIFSLGKTLYEAATGRDRQQFPELPTQLGDETSEREFLEFNEILVKACHPIAKERYRRMRDLHSDLQVLSAGQSLRRLRALERRIRVGRNTVAAILALLALAAFPVFHFVSISKAKREARQRQVGTEVANGSRDVSQGSYLTALPRFAEALRIDLGDAERETVHKLRIESSLLFAPRLLHTINVGSDVQNVEFSADGARLLVTRYFDSVIVFDAPSAATLHGPFSGVALRKSALSPDGQTIFTAAETALVHIRNLVTGEHREAFNQPDRIMSVAHHPKEKWLLTGCNDGIARVWDLETDKVLIEFKGHAEGVLDAKFSPDGRYVATTSKDRTVRTWNAATGEKLATIAAHRDWVLHVNFHPSRNWLITSSHDGSARVWTFPGGEPVGRPLIHRDSAANARFSPDGRYILTAGHDGSARLWDCVTWKEAARNAVLPHSAKVKDATFSPDGRRIATACFDGTVRIWDLSEVGLPVEATPEIYSGDGQWAASVTNRVMTLRPALRSTAQTRTLHLPDEPVAFNLSFNGQAAFAIFPTNGVRVARFWKISPPSIDPLGEILLSATNTIASVTVSEDVALAAAVLGVDVVVSDFNSSRTRTFTHTNLVTSFAISRDNRTVAAADGESAYLWHLQETVRSNVIPLARSPIAVRFSPDSSKLAVATLDIYYNPCFAQIFDSRTGSPITKPLPHEDGVLAVGFSQGSDLLVTSGEDLRAQIWRATDGLRFGPPLLHDRQVRLANFCMGDRFIATTDRVGMVRLFETATGDPITPAIPGGSPRPRHLALNGSSLFCIENTGRAVRWALPGGATDSRELLRFVDYLTSRTLLGEPAQTAFASLPIFNKYVTVTPAQIAEWHIREADEARAENNSAAAEFHLAIALKSADPHSPLHAQIGSRLRALSR